jgi:abortive infection bacteriophage resistance protein
MAKVPYTKRALSYADQLSKLQSRGLKIDNAPKALHLLEQISYYRLSGYWYPLLEEPKAEHKFKPDATFETGFKLYCFDRELRKFVQTELEKIEISIRAKMIYEFWHNNDAFWYKDRKHYKNGYSFDILIGKLEYAVSKSDEDFIKSFGQKYSDSLPPACMVLEVSSFGNLSNLFGNLSRKTPEARAIANYYGLDETTFASWIHSLTYVRNLCAHHSRLWNRIMGISPKIPDSPKKIFISNTLLPNPSDENKPYINNNRVYYLLSMIIYLMNTINPNHRVKEKFLDLLKLYPLIDIKSMGFPNGWQEEHLWK